MTRLANPTTNRRTTLARAASLLALTAGLALPAAAQPAAAAAAPAAPASGAPLGSNRDRVSYATGVMTVRNLLKNEVAFDFELLLQGMKDGMAGGAIRMSEKDIKQVVQSMSADIQRRLTNERQAKAGIAREAGVLFLNEYRAKPGVVVLPGNLMYRVITEGKGDKPRELGTAVVKYRGALIDGTEVESTPEGKTVTVKLNEVITGWREALKQMPAGSTWEIVVPSAMAYGTRGAGSIGPNETLVFTIELVAVVQ
jgi:FKBP-type peptidyl-prolyl cis-trans isomerase FklB